MKGFSPRVRVQKHLVRTFFCEPQLMKIQALPPERWKRFLQPLLPGEGCAAQGIAALRRQER